MTASSELMLSHIRDLEDRINEITASGGDATDLIKELSEYRKKLTETVSMIDAGGTNLIKG